MQKGMRKVVTRIYWKDEENRPLLHIDLLLEVVSFLSIAELTKSINLASSSLWYYDCKFTTVLFTVY